MTPEASGLTTAPFLLPQDSNSLYFVSDGKYCSFSQGFNFSLSELHLGDGFPSRVLIKKKYKCNMFITAVCFLFLIKG